MHILNVPALNLHMDCMRNLVYNWNPILLHIWPKAQQDELEHVEHGDGSTVLLFFSTRILSKI